ncbi:hypothetical protein CMI47_03000 [Candidatus Pacearchaeota archaeon]|nr:hypothetical protein [Candidatus Pacearchaeota archaeon]|tara:strand:- start:189 stop:1541 length:1353 start_codon:yes stop_codon:yes gene_type:complete
MPPDFLQQLGTLMQQDPLQDRVGQVVDWFDRERGDPPMVTVTELQLKGKQRAVFPNLHYHKNPYPWPAGLRKRELVLVAASGGVDSTAVALLARKKFPKAMIIMTRADTGFEPEDSVKILRALSRKIRAPVITIEPTHDLFELIERNGRIPNRAFGDWCTQALKGGNLDRMGWYLTLGRDKRTTVHTSGLLAEEPDRVADMLKFSRIRFWDGKGAKKDESETAPKRGMYLMKERALLAEDKINKAKAVQMIKRAGLPISTVYLDRTRHGCIPCRWWNEAQWRDFYRLDKPGFERASKLEQRIAIQGKTHSRGKYPKGRVAPKLFRIWFPGPSSKYPRGNSLQEWLRIWDRELPGWRKAPLEFPNLVRPEDIPCSVAPTSWRLRVLANRIRKARRNEAGFGGWSIRAAVEADGPGLPWVVEHYGTPKRRFRDYSAAWRWMRMIYRKGGGTA